MNNRSEIDKNLNRFLAEIGEPDYTLCTGATLVKYGYWSRQDLFDYLESIGW